VDAARHKASALPFTHRALTVGNGQQAASLAWHLRGLDPQTRIIIGVELRYKADEGARVSRVREHRPALATIMPDGTVIAGDAFPTSRADIVTSQARSSAPRPGGPDNPYYQD
jgi:hypothetical protein